MTSRAGATAHRLRSLGLRQFGYLGVPRRRAFGLAFPVLDRQTRDVGPVAVLAATHTRPQSGHTTFHASWSSVAYLVDLFAAQPKNGKGLMPLIWQARSE